MTESSRRPDIAICKVRGMGVAVRVSTWTLARIAFSRSLWVTPKRCSSSTMTSPRFLNSTVLARRAWVPMTISTLPALRPSLVSFDSLAETSRESRPISIGKPRKRSQKVW